MTEIWKCYGRKDGRTQQSMAISIGKESYDINIKQKARKFAQEKKENEEKKQNIKRHLKIPPPLFFTRFIFFFFFLIILEVTNSTLEVIARSIKPETSLTRNAVVGNTSPRTRRRRRRQWRRRRRRWRWNGSRPGVTFPATRNTYFRHFRSTRRLLLKGINPQNHLLVMNRLWTETD